MTNNRSECPFIFCLILVKMAAKLCCGRGYSSTSNQGRSLGHMQNSHCNHSAHFRYHPHIQVWTHPVPRRTRTVTTICRLQNGYFKIQMGDVTIAPSISTQDHKEVTWTEKRRVTASSLVLLVGLRQQDTKASFISALMI